MYRAGNMTRKEFFSAVSKDTGKAVAISTGFTVGLGLGSAFCKHLTTSSSTFLSTTGYHLGEILGPGVLVGTLGYQARFLFFTSVER